MKKVAVIVGHNSKSQGAVAKMPLESYAGNPETLSEFIFNSGVARRMKGLKNIDLHVEVFERVKTTSYSKEIRDVYEKTDEWGADITIELHFNSFWSPAATGSTVLCSNSEASKKLAICVQKEMLKTLNLRDRGIMVTAPNANGWLSVNTGKAPAILVEPFFGSNIDDVRAAFILGYDGMADMYLKGIQAYFDDEYAEKIELPEDKTLTEATNLINNIKSSLSRLEELLNKG